jgi:hypothetical protein
VQLWSGELPRDNSRAKKVELLALWRNSAKRVDHRFADSSDCNRGFVVDAVAHIDVLPGKRADDDAVAQVEQLAFGPHLVGVPCFVRGASSVNESLHFLTVLIVLHHFQHR